jgi:hypothetical protein
MINLYYDNLLAGNGSNLSSNPAVRPSPSIPEHLTLADIPYNIKTLNDLSNTDDLNLYVIELFYVNRLDEIFENISQLAYQKLQCGELKLLIYFPFEGFNLELYDNWFLKLHQLFNTYNLNGVKKYFIYNNLTIETQYQELKDNNLIPVGTEFTKVFGYPYFHFEYYNIIKQRHIDFPNEKINVTNLTNKEKNFLSLNSKIRAHRILIISELYRRKLVDNSFLSFIGSPFDHPETTIEYAKKSLDLAFDKMPFVPKEIKAGVEIYTKNWQPLMLDGSATDIYINSVVAEHYEKSYFSIVTETGMDNYLRVTEKTFKPIANYHPFMIIGCHGTLEYLRSLGYQTFPELFDESYDQETNIAKRLLMIINQVEKFVNLSKEEKDKKYQQVHEKVLYNANLFFNVLPEINRLQFVNMFKELRNDK